VDTSIITESEGAYHRIYANLPAPNIGTPPQATVFFHPCSEQNVLNTMITSDPRWDTIYSSSPVEEYEDRFSAVIVTGLEPSD